MRFVLTVLLSVFALNICIAQVTNSDGSIIIRITPDGSFTDSIFVDFTGTWSPGFESNTFTPCGNWTPDSLGGVMFVTDRIGLSKGKAIWDYLITSQDGSVIRSKDISGDSALGLFVNAEGWLVGPGSYDHFGQNLYTLKTVRFNSVKWAKAGECEN